MLADDDVPEAGLGREENQLQEGLSQPASVWVYEGGRLSPAKAPVPQEGLVRLHVNGYELARLMCSPYALEQLALGFLASEGIIREMGDVRLVKECPSRACVDVWLRDANFELPTGRPTLTSGCGGGLTFTDLTVAAEPLVSSVRVSGEQIARLMRELLTSQPARGLHTAALADGDQLVAIASDVGRHNTVDRLWGQCLLRGLHTRDRILLSTGRISSEMVGKAARMGVPVVVSRTAPTGLSVALALAWNVTLVGYARRITFNVYSGKQRVVEDEEALNDAHS